VDTELFPDPTERAGSSGRVLSRIDRHPCGSLA